MLTSVVHFGLPCAHQTLELLQKYAIAAFLIPTQATACYRLARDARVSAVVPPGYRTFLRLWDTSTHSQHSTVKNCFLLTFCRKNLRFRMINKCNLYLNCQQERVLTLLWMFVLVCCHEIQTNQGHNSLPLDEFLQLPKKTLKKHLSKQWSKKLQIILHRVRNAIIKTVTFEDLWL